MPSRRIVIVREYWVSSYYATYSFEVKAGKVVEIAPIAKWAVGSSLKDILRWHKTKGFKIVPLSKRKIMQYKEPNPYEDGINHINIYSKGATTLGRFLSNFTISPISMPEGRFLSVEGYWHYLGTCHPRREELKFKHGFQAKQLGEELKKTHPIFDPKFRDKITLALRRKLLSSPAMRKEFLENVIPLRHYYVYNGRVIQPQDSQWLIDAYGRCMTIELEHYV